MSEPAFEAALAFVRKWEGGLADHPEDPGGITKWGVSLRFLRLARVDFNGDGVIDGHDVRAMTEQQAAHLYRTRFWDQAGCAQVPAPIALALFDGAVNQGVGRAVRLLQSAAGAKADGAIGPKTRAAIAARDTRTLLRDFMARRAAHYSSLAIVATFGLGWFRRLFDAHAHALDLFNLETKET